MASQKKANQNKPENRTIIIEHEVNWFYSSGLYHFFCKTTARLFMIIYSILQYVKDPAAIISGIDYQKLVSCIWIVNHMANKLEGISSVSSSVHDNFFCKCRQNITDCICQYCYAYNQQSYQTGLKEHNIINGLILRNILIPVEFFRALSILFPYLRIESFGDVANIIQARNYIRIIKAFPEKRCAVWSKNKKIWKQAIAIEGKPDNMTYVHSSSKLNVPDPVDLTDYPFIDHIFTVYTKAYARKHNININCGGRKCMDCIRKQINCYFRNTEFYINELKK